jgi:hypothetical protein
MVFWLSLAAWILLSAAGIAFAVVRALALWRGFRRTSGRLSSQLGEIAAATEQIEGHLDRAEAARGRLQAASARLSTSRAELAVLLGAVREARATIEQALPFAAPPRR